MDLKNSVPINSGAKKFRRSTGARLCTGARWLMYQVAAAMSAAAMAPMNTRSDGSDEYMSAGSATMARRAASTHQGQP